MARNDVSSWKRIPGMRVSPVTLRHRLIKTLILVIGFVFAVAISWVTIARFERHAQASATAWEYKIVLGEWDEKRMSALGAEGWELVAVDASRGDSLRAFFKRPR